MKESTCLAYAPRFLADVFFPQNALTKNESIRATFSRLMRQVDEMQDRLRMAKVPVCGWLGQNQWKRVKTNHLSHIFLVPSQLPGIFTHVLFWWSFRAWHLDHWLPMLALSPGELCYWEVQVQHTRGVGARETAFVLGFHSFESVHHSLGFPGYLVTKLEVNK